MLKILSIGNSFSMDAHTLLREVCASAGQEVKCINAYIGGCSLEHHTEVMATGEPVYQYQIDGVGDHPASLIEMLQSDDWDIITLQQVSGLSGVPQSYIPYLQQVRDFAAGYCPKAKFWIHQTWAYDAKSDHRDFPLYDCDQQEMFRRLSDAGEMASRLIGAPVLPAGRAIQYVREHTVQFDANTGMSLNRDGYHLNLIYGAYIAAIAWYCAIFNGKPADVTFIPEGADPALIETIKSVLGELY